MNDTVITTYFQKSIKGFAIKKTIINGLLFFFTCAIKAKSLMPTKVGRETITSYQRHGIKRCHRLLTNKFLTKKLMDEIYLFLLKKILKNKTKIVLAMDWTTIRGKFNFLCISWVLNSGHSIPLYFTGYEHKTLTKGYSQTTIEKRSIEKIIKTLGFQREIILLADRGFDSPEFLKHLEYLKIKYVIRASSNQWVYLKNTHRNKLGKNIIKKGSQLKYLKIKYTQSSKHCCNLYLKWQKNQKEPWLLLSNISSSIKVICDLYARRWSIEEMFKSLKNEDVGFDIRKIRLRHFERWLRLLFISTIFFQAIGMLGHHLRKVDDIEKPYTMSSKTPKKQQYIFSIFSISILVILDRMIKLRYSVLSGFQIKWAKTSWISLQ